VVFDVDDTLYLERDYVRSGFTAVAEVLARDHGIASFQEEAWAAFLRGERGDIFDTTLRALTGEAPRSLVELCVDVYRNHAPTIALLPDASSFVAWCVTRFSTGVVSDGPQASQRAKVVALGLTSQIDRIVLTGEMGSGWAKPSSQSFRLLEQELGFHGEECVYLADNPIKDFVGPLELGWRTVRVRRQNGLHENAMSDQDAAMVIDDLGNDSLASLENIFGQVPHFRPAGEGEGVAS
jgi:putative hydrolase of the HAD superfamily